MRASKNKYINSIDTELQLLVSKGNEVAFEEVFERKQAFIYNYAMRLTRSCDLAQEVVQEIFIKIWTNRVKITEVENLDAYLNRATRNQCYTVLRKVAAEALRRVPLDECEIADSHSAEGTALYNDSVKMLRTVVDKLPPQRKLVYQLCHEQGYTYDEVASKLHISSGTVHTHMGNAILGTTMTIKTNGQLPTKRSFFVRVGARIQYGLKYYNYTDVKTVTIP